MPSQVLSDKLIKSLRPPEAGQLEIFDTILPGFGIRVSQGGRKAWILLYRVNGRKRRMTLGAYPALSLSAARTAAGKAIQDVQRGDDPALEQMQKRAVQPTTFGELADDYLERYAKVYKRSWKNDDLFLRLHILPKWKHRRVDSIKRADVVALIDEAEARLQPHLARQLLAVTRKLFNWAIEKSLADSNPAMNIRLSTKPQDRSRTLSWDEIFALWNAWDTMAEPWTTYFKVLLLTGQRRAEVANMKWQDISDGVWIIPAEENKSNRLHAVPLSSAVLSLIEARPETTSPYVFPARSSRLGKDHAPISGFSGAVRKVNEALAEPIEWRVHDLRRTATSNMARLGFQPHILSAVLNHAPQSAMKGVLSVYNRHKYLDEKREALDAWGKEVVAVIEKKRKSVEGECRAKK